MAAEEIELEVLGTAVAVPRDVIRRLAAAAAQHAGVSSRHRDLSLVLGRALDSGKVSLGRGETRALRAVLEEVQDGFGESREALLRLTA
jgi:hypothetical protein